MCICLRWKWAQGIKAVSNVINMNFICILVMNEALHEHVFIRVRVRPSSLLFMFVPDLPVTVTNMLIRYARNHPRPWIFIPEHGTTALAELYSIEKAHIPMSSLSSIDTGNKRCCSQKGESKVINKEVENIEFKVYTSWFTQLIWLAYV